MPFSLSLADRLRDCLDRYPNIVEKKMFGGLGFLLQGNMLLGIWRDYLILRLGPEQAKVALKQKKFKVFDITGKPMKGWVMIHEEYLADDLMLKKWLQIAMEYVITLPARKK